MSTTRKVNFEFRNQVSPRYIEPLMLQLEPDHWYESTELQQVLRNSGLNVQGKDIVHANTTFWGRLGLGELRRQGVGSPNLFRLTAIGKQVVELFSTNQALFYDMMHYLFYSAWRRSHLIGQAPFWLYAEICDTLWQQAPNQMDSFTLTAAMQLESRRAFPAHDPSFSERSVRSVFPWLGALSPPFLSKCGTKSELCSQRRNFCTPQLFHLAVDLAYQEAGLSYGTSLAIDERQTEIICRVCLLDTERFWEMASLADMAVREFEVRKGQWGTSLALGGPPRWIELPDYTAAVGDGDEDEDEEEDE